MIALNNRIALLDKLGKYISTNDNEWKAVKDNAWNKNAFFTPENIELAAKNIANNYLNRDLLENWIKNYKTTESPKTVGVVMAGNIPMVGFHDILCVFMSGHKAMIKISSKDDVLIPHLMDKLIEWNENVRDHIIIAENLKNCDAYIATGSNNTSRYFERYFSKNPNIIRKNRTSVAILDGNETENEIQRLGDDIFRYFGLGCRNISKLYVPMEYDIKLILKELENRKDIIHHSKYKNNYDYYLSIYMLNKVDFYTNGSLILLESKDHFSPISVVNYEYYSDKDNLLESLQNDDNVQCIVGKDNISYGDTQSPQLNDYADGADIMMFLNEL